MAKVSQDQLEYELREKHLFLESNYEEYKSINSPITVKCINGHKMETSLKTIRNPQFVCNMCVGGASKGKSVSNTVVPPKKGYRIVGFDNASHNMGVAIFDDGKLVYYDLLQFSEGTAIQRLNRIRDVLENEIIPKWEPDFIQFEGVQHQNSYATYDVLLKLLGLFEMACERYNVNYSSNRSSEWRGHHGINRKNRALDKAAAIQKVKEMYNIVVGDDVAEAILIAKFRSDLDNKKDLKDLF